MNERLRSDRGLWLAVILVFGLMLGAWTTMFVIAAKHPVATVPLEHRAGGEPRS